MTTKKLTIDDEETGVKFTFQYDLDRVFPRAIDFNRDSNGTLVIQDNMALLDISLNGKFVEMNSSYFESIFSIIQAMLDGQLGLLTALGDIKSICKMAIQRVSR